MEAQAFAIEAAMQRRFGPNLAEQHGRLEKILAKIKNDLHYSHLNSLSHSDHQINAISHSDHRMRSYSIPKAKIGRFYAEHHFTDFSFEGYEIRKRKLDTQQFESVLLAAIVVDKIKELKRLVIDVQFNPEHFQKRNIERKIEKEFPLHIHSVEAVNENIYASFGKYIGSTASALDYYFMQDIETARKLHVEPNYKTRIAQNVSFSSLQFEFIAGLSRAVNETVPEYGKITTANLNEMISFAQLNWTDIKTINTLYQEYARIRNKNYNIEKLFSL